MSLPAPVRGGWRHRVAEDGAIRVEGRPLGAQVLRVRVLGRLFCRAAKPRDGVCQLALLEVFERLGQRDDVVAVAAALHALDAGAHLALAHDRERSFRGHRRAQCAVQGVDIFTVNAHALHSVTLERLGDIVPLEVLSRMTSDSDIVVIDNELSSMQYILNVIKRLQSGKEYLDVQTTRHSQACSLRIIAFLLGSIRAQANGDLPRICKRYTVHHWPHVPQPSRAELNSRSASKLGMAWKMSMPDTVILQVRCRNLAPQRR
jgi:hypothetical protein